MCNFCPNEHIVETVTATATELTLTVTNDTNISNLEDFIFKTGCKSIGDVVTGAPIPVVITVNGAAVELRNRFSLQIQSNRVPRRALGTYVVPPTGAPFVILHTTPCKKINA